MQPWIFSFFVLRFQFSAEQDPNFWHLFQHQSWNGQKFWLCTEPESWGHAQRGGLGLLGFLESFFTPILGSSGQCCCNADPRMMHTRHKFCSFSLCPFLPPIIHIFSPTSKGKMCYQGRNCSKIQVHLAWRIFLFHFSILDFPKSSTQSPLLLKSSVGAKIGMRKEIQSGNEVWGAEKPQGSCDWDGKNGK